MSILVHCPGGGGQHRSRALPTGGFHPEPDVPALLASFAEARPDGAALVCGSGPAVAVLACAGMAVTAIESDGRALAVTEEMLAAVGARATLIEAELEPYDRHNLWYVRHRLGRLPAAIDLLFVDGPGPFAGRMPRWPAGPELFPRLTGRGVVVLDAGRRVKEKKALARWAEAFPGLEQIDTQRSGGAVMLRPRQGEE